MILDLISSCSTVLKLINSSQRIERTTNNLNTYIISSDYKKNNRMIFVVLPTLFDAQKYYDNLINLLDERDVLFFPVDDIMANSLFVSSSDFRYERINTLISLLDGRAKIVVTTVNGILKGNMALNDWKANSRTFEVNKTYSLQEIKEYLQRTGYIHTNIVESTGQYSFRGSIIDLFPLNLDNPIRLDFFDDELDEIKVFDAETQRSIKKIKKVTVYPISEIFYDDNKLKNALSVLNAEIINCSNEERSIIDKDIFRIKERNELDLIVNYIDLFSQKESVVSFTENPKVYLIDEDKIIATYNKAKEKSLELYKDLNSKVIVKHQMLMDYNEVLSRLDVKKMDTLVDHSEGIMVGIKDIENFNGNFNLITKYIINLYNTNKIILALKSKDKISRLKKFFLDNSIGYNSISNPNDLQFGVVNIIDEYAISCFLPKDSLCVLGESTLFSQEITNRKIRYKSTFSSAIKINKLDELEIGDYVVHVNHGIGIYDGIKTIELSGKKKDYLNLIYKDSDRLYIPIDQINLIKKYASSSDAKPQLTKLGTSSWEKTKQKVKEKVNQLGDKLIQLYSERENAVGFKFQKDTKEQQEFENDFAFEETIDQKKAISAVKKDMESTKPMDRLICGDVGFGKTEVALRAAFKAVMNGKQVCYLAPTTILTRQHYYTFFNRMSKYGVRVELLNRFVGAKQTKQILKDLEFGTVDVLIGTHRVLSGDVKFKDLGLLITDEEQRFGVLHKEKIKEMKVNVDSLMLTATPIPRTLQMSLIGIKELSMIETPPLNRYPVQTFVMPRYQTIIKEAIERELLRGGQVFYLYNYTDDIYDMMITISKMVPEAKVCYAHGKMNKNDLEQIVSDFIDHKYDVMVSTTIIETGIDIPEANTLIIHDADRLGLSQLYQIRGRVGRSDKIAYAYLMYEPNKILSSDAEKRLNAIKEFTELGSGFKIAMRDLAIRGAGDLLGSEQSGFINSVGIDLYLEILDEAMKEKQGKIKKDVATRPFNPTVLSNRFIPDKYGLSEDLKIEMHNKISSIKNIKDLENLKSEFEDRFGKIDQSLIDYMYERLFNHLCVVNDVEKIDIKPKIVNLTLSENRSQNLNGEFVYRSAYELSNQFLLSYHDKKITITLKTISYPNNSWLPIISQYLTKIA